MQAPREMLMNRLGAEYDCLGDYSVVHRTRYVKGMERPEAWTRFVSVTMDGFMGDDSDLDQPCTMHFYDVTDSAYDGDPTSTKHYATLRDAFLATIGD